MQTMKLTIKRDVNDKCTVITNTGYVFLSQACWRSAFETAAQVCRMYGYRYVAGGEFT